MKKILFLIFAMALFGAGCAPKNMMNKVSFLTSDGVKIVGNWFPAAGNTPAVLLLHMRPATKESWNDFAAKLNLAGFSALAIDLRGHGESTDQNGKKINYESFPDGSHAECRLDVDAAIDWLKKQGVGEIYVVGGSIGANLAIDAMARYSETKPRSDATASATGVKKGAALSPGLEYLGVAADGAIKKFAADQKIFLIASKDDAYSYDSVLKLRELNPSAETKLYNDAGHATNMFSAEPKLMDEIVEWLKQ